MDKLRDGRYPVRELSFCIATTVQSCITWGQRIHSVEPLNPAVHGR